ncbi:MAG: FUSC family protein [Bryobacteraceae bacterium]
MASLAETVPAPSRPLARLEEFLKEELTPYPGRVALVARMAITATLMMIITMTFKIPDGAYGGVFALQISRESPQTTLENVKTIIVAFVLGAAYVLVGARFFVEDPTLRLFWVIGTLFILFYAISAMTNYGAASRFGYLVAISVPLWDSRITAEQKVEGTLWAVLVITITSVLTLAIELVFAAIRPGDDFLRSIADRLSSVEELLACYSEERPVDQTVEKRVTRFAMLGTSRLRRGLRRSAYSRQYAEQMGAVVALVGRVVDVAANLMYLNIHIPGHERERIRRLRASISTIRADLLNGKVPNPIETEASVGVPLLREMETTVSLIPGVFSASQAVPGYVPPLGEDKRSSLFVPDALSNSDHIKFGIKGGLAASLCYIIYNAIAWPGISTAVVTCLLTALTTIGASRQKQVLRFAGAVVGGFVIAMGSQVFILPHIDSIGGFTIFVLVVTCAASWLATAGPRISYFGIQLAIAFYLINLQEFKVQTSLAVARDRVVGILLGLIMMWLVFDQLWGAPAVVEMKKIFILNLRSLAQLVREPVPGEIGAAIERTFSLRETINANFDKARAQADGVLFEFGTSRHQDLALRDQIRRWQPQLRTLFVTRIALLKYRFQLPGFELPEPVHLAQQEFDDRLRKMLDGMADRMEGKAPDGNENFEDSFERLEQTVQKCCSEGPQEPLTEELHTFLTLCRSTENLATSLNKEI